MKAYFEKVFQKGNTLYCMSVQKPFIDSRGNLTKEAYYIYASMILDDGCVTDWEYLKSYENKTQAEKAFEKLIIK